MLEPFPLLVSNPSQGAHLLSDYMIHYSIIVNNTIQYLAILISLYFSNCSIIRESYRPCFKNEDADTQQA